MVLRGSISSDFARKLSSQSRRTADLGPLFRIKTNATVPSKKSKAKRARLLAEKAKLVWDVVLEVQKSRIEYKRRVDFYRHIEELVSKKNRFGVPIKISFIENVIRNNGRFVSRGQKKK